MAKNTGKRVGKFAIIGIILGKSANSDVKRRADINTDGEINISDVNATIAIILKE